MRKGIINRFITCMIVSLYLPIRNVYGHRESHGGVFVWSKGNISCPNGISDCFEVGGETNDFMGKTSCSFCGSFSKADSDKNDKLKCRFTWTHFIFMAEYEDMTKKVILGYHCEIKSFCKTGPVHDPCKKYVDRVKRCEEIFLMDECCICKENFGGKDCQSPAIVSFRTWSTAVEPVRVKLDLRMWSNCWTHYYQTKLPMTPAADKRISRIIISQKEPSAKAPFWVKLYTGLFEHHFTKFNRKVKKSEAVTWCLTHTNLKQYCERFQIFFLPEFNHYDVIQERNIIFSKAETYFVTENQIGTQEEDIRGNIVWLKFKQIGYYQLLRSEVLPFLPEPPLYRNDKFISEVEKKDLRLFMQSRGTFVDYGKVNPECYPRIMTLCNTHYDVMAVYPYMPVSFKIEFTPPPSACKETKIARWQIFQMKSNVDYEEGEEIYSRYGCCAIHFPPYHFPVGKYHVRYTMMHEWNGQQFFTSKGCVQTVYHDKIEAEFSELTRVVNTEDVNTVEVEAWNINVKLMEQKQNLSYRWFCWIDKTDGECELNRFLKNVPSFRIPPWTLKVNYTYHLKVEVIPTVRLYSRFLSDPFLATKGVAYHNLIVTSKEVYLVTLVCGTCDDSLRIDPQEFNFIFIRRKDGVSEPVPNDYKWEFAEETKAESGARTVGKFRPVDDIRDDSPNSNSLLKIKKNVFGFGQAYIFQVSVPHKKYIFAQIRISTVHAESVLTVDLNCTLTPTEGVRGWTDFNVACFFSAATQLFFEFFDKDTIEDRVFSGRMIGYNTFGSLYNFKMTKGTLVIYVFNKNSVKNNFTLSVNLFPYNDTLYYLENLLRIAGRYSKNLQSESPAATVSSVAEVIEQAMGPPDDVIRQFVYILDKARATFILGLVKIVLSSLKIVLLNTAGKFIILELDAFLTKTAAKKLLYLSSKIIRHEGSLIEEQALPVSVIYDMIKTVLDCAEIIIEQKNRPYRSKPEYYVIPVISDLVQTASIAVVNALDISSYSLNRQQVPGDTVNELYSDGGKIIAITKVDFAQPLSNWSMITNNSFVVICNQSIYEDEGRSKLYGLQYIRMLTNPFWWAGDNIVSEVLIVNICRKTDALDCLKLTRFKTCKVKIMLNVIEPLNLFPIEGDAYQVNPKTSDEMKELDLTVHRFFLPERAKLVLKFFINDAEEYRIKLTEGLRPEYNEMVGNHIVIKANSTDYEVPYENKHPNEKIYYMGILPSTKVSIGERVPFRLKAYYTLCNSWMKWQWTSSGCWVGDESSEESIHCDCDHLSVIGGGITTPENSLSTVSEFLLYLTPWENLLPLLITLIIVLIYLMILLWAIMKDKKDKRGGEVIVLEDNFPDEPYAYLIGVHTGSRLFSGTSATVGIRLLGDATDSRPHILRSPDRKVLNSFSEDWFLIYFRRHLGKILKLWLWHNDEGCAPDWFVERIQVYDLHINLLYVFEINSWIAMEVNSFPDVLVAPKKRSEDFSDVATFRNNFADGIRDTHKWTSVCLKHPRNSVSRGERVSVLVCFVLSALATCLLLYLFHFGFSIDEDKPSYYFDITDLFIFIVTLIIPSIVALLIMVLFRKSFTANYDVIETKNKEVLKNLEENGSNKDQSPRQKGLSVCLQKIVRGNTLKPIRLTRNKSDQIVFKPCLIAAWIFCVCVIFMSLIIILLYAWKLPTVKNGKVLIIFLGVVVFDAFVLSILKIFIFAAVMTCLRNKAELENTCNIDIEVGKRSHLFGNIDFLTNLLGTRKQKIYYPLSETEKEKRRKITVIRYRWRILMEFVMIGISVCFAFAVCSIFYVDRYASNSHATHMITTGPSKSLPTLQQVFNRTDLYDFLEITLINQLFRYMWYNYEPLIDPESNRIDWTNDCVSRLLGNIRIRQLRVSMNSCRVSGYFNDSIEFCAASWSTGAEDNKVYATSWRLPDQEDIARKIPTWRYTKPENSNYSTWFYGQSGTMYHGGGYIADLGYFKKRTRGTLLTLEKEDWLDHMTRAVFVEIPLFNINTDLFTEVVLVCEQHPTGQYISIQNVESGTIDAGFDFWNIGFIILQVFFLCKTLYFMNRYGVFVYLSSALNKYGTFCLVLGFLTIALYVVHVKYSSLHVENYLRSGLDGSFSFYVIFQYEFKTKSVLSALLIFVIIRFLLSWRFGKIYFSFFFTFVLSWSWIIWLTLYYMIYLTILWRFIGYNINVYIFSYFSSPLLYSKDFKITGVHERWSGHLVVYLMCILTSFVILLFITSFVHFYGVAKYFKPLAYSKIAEFSYVKFFKEEYKRILRKEKQQD